MVYQISGVGGFPLQDMQCKEAAIPTSSPPSSAPLNRWSELLQELHHYKKTQAESMALMTTSLEPRLSFLLLTVYLHVSAWPLESGVSDQEGSCPSSEWSIMCRPCCEYQLIQCKCPAQPRVRVGYTVPCCRNALDQCDPCIIHPGCSLFENCKSCNNGTWKSNDDFFVRGTFCRDCRQGWSGGDCKTCGGVLQRAHGTVALESYPTNARCEWRVQVNPGHNIELRFSVLSMESDHHCGYDYIELRDGDSVTSPVLGRYCGPELPPPVRTTGNVLHILFASDGYTNLDGFVLHYQQSSAVSVVECRPPEKPVNGDVLPVYGPGQRLLSVSYVCHPTFTLFGSEQRTCLPNATWTGTEPKCVKVVSRGHCAPPPKILNGYHKPVVARTGSSGGSKMEFFCKKSYILSGEPTLTCLSNGSWSSRPPQCVRACREPKVSQLVSQTVLKPHQTSNKVDMSSAYHVLPSSFRLFTSQRHPKSEATTLPVLPRGFHHVHTSIEYNCSSPLYRHSGSSRRSCLKTGKWTGRHVSCSPVCGKVPSFSSQDPLGTHWPWHAAIYVRSPATHSAGNAPDGQQGSSGEQEEAAASWHLVCSGALAALHSVLVAAHCVVSPDTERQRPLHPDHVRVVLGMQYKNASEGQANVLQRLRVSSILVHPNYKSTLDSNLAILKLQEKARISRRVSPVCLPKMQGGEVMAMEAYAARWTVGHDAPMWPGGGHTDLTKVVEVADFLQCKREFARMGTDESMLTDNVLCLISKPSSQPDGPCPNVMPGIAIIPSVPSPVVPTTGTPLLSGQTEKHRDDAFVWELFGLESLFHDQNECHRLIYTGHTQIRNFRNWIEKNMK